MALATVAELKKYMSGVTLTSDQGDVAEIVLAGLQSDLETYLNRPVERRTITASLWPASSGFIQLETPIVSITSITQNGVVLGAAYYDIVPGGVYVGGTSSYPSVVVYVAGLDGASIPNMKLAILRAAAREMTYKHDDTVSIKGLASRNVAEGEPSGGGSKPVWGFKPEELAAFDRYRRRVVVSSGEELSSRFLVL